MPQMAPLNWSLLFMMFTLIFLFSICKMFFHLPSNPTTSMNYFYKINQKINIWKW